MVEEKSEINERFAAFRRSKCSTVKEFSVLTDVPFTTIKSVEEGPSQPGSSLLSKVKSTFPDLDLNWLFTGKSSNEISQSPKMSFDELVPVYKYDVQVSAGVGVSAPDEETSILLWLPKYIINQKCGYVPSRLSIVTVTGDSMEPTLYDNDLALVDMQNVTLSCSGLYVVNYSNELFIKRLHKLPDNKIDVISDNKLYDKFTVSNGNDFRIIGKVVSFIRAEANLR